MILISIRMRADEVERIRARVREANGLTYQCDPDCSEWVLPKAAKERARELIYDETGRMPKLSLYADRLSEDGYRAAFQQVGWHKNPKEPK